MTFNTNLAFKLFAFFYGDYDGETIQTKRTKSALLFIYSRFWILVTIYDIIRFMVLIILPNSKHEVLEFYLCDFASAIKGKPYKLLLSAGPLFNGR